MAEPRPGHPRQDGTGVLFPPLQVWRLAVNLPAIWKKVTPRLGVAARWLMRWRY
jgi:hypothetical protein